MFTRSIRIAICFVLRVLCGTLRVCRNELIVLEWRIDPDSYREVESAPVPPRLRPTTPPAPAPAKAAAPAQPVSDYW